MGYNGFFFWAQFQKNHFGAGLFPETGMRDYGESRTRARDCKPDYKTEVIKK